MSGADRPRGWLGHLPPDDLAARKARRHIVLLCAGHPDDVRYDVELCVSEAVNNAATHGRTPIDIAAWVVDDRLHVEVTDHGPGWPERRAPDLDEPGGRGLAIIDGLADEWGVKRIDHAGKTLWFNLSLSSRRAAR